MKPLLDSNLRTGTLEELEAAYDLGLIRKSALVHGLYYRGSCRNAECARWHSGGQQFLYLRAKFGQSIVETICHPVDEPRYDVFLAVEHIEPGPEHRIDDGVFEQYFG